MPPFTSVTGKGLGDHRVVSLPLDDAQPEKEDH